MGKTENPDVLGQVINERERQDEKWGEQNHTPDKWILILSEEVGEAAKALLEGDANYRSEMIQIAAVAIAATESFDRMKWNTRATSEVVEALEKVKGRICGCPQVKELVSGEQWYGYRTKKVLEALDTAIKEAREGEEGDKGG